MPSTGRFFDVQLRTDEEWAAAGYPAKTFYAVDYHGGICNETEPDSSIATVWVHADAYSRMSNERLGDEIQKILAVEVIVQILQESIEEWKDRETAEPRSPLATLLRKINPDTPISIADLRSLVEGPRRNTLRPLLHDDIGLVRAFS